MTNQQINEAVAQKLGWAKLEKPDYSLDHPYWWLNVDGVQSDLPDYCHSIEAAWEIVQKKPMALLPLETGWLASWKQGPAEEGHGEEWWFPSYCLTRDECQCGGCAIADTAPMAICKAFLRLP